MEYPKVLHKNHNELPFLVERMKIRREEKLVQILKIKRDTKCTLKNWIKH